MKVSIRYGKKAVLLVTSQPAERLLMVGQKAPPGVSWNSSQPFLKPLTNLSQSSSRLVLKLRTACPETTHNRSKNSSRPVPKLLTACPKTAHDRSQSSSRTCPKTTHNRCKSSSRILKLLTTCSKLLMALYEAHLNLSSRSLRPAIKVLTAPQNQL